MWFEKLTGFAEKSPRQVRKNIAVSGPLMTSQVNGRKMICGVLETPPLAELRECVRAHGRQRTKLALREVVADATHLHVDESNAGALFQVASQFNLLEMTGPGVTPEQGVDRYEHDLTQGPACAIAAGAGTIYRNYFAQVNGQIGQSTGNQIDCLADIGAALGNTGCRLWEMRNGYAMPSRSGLLEVVQRLKVSSEEELDRLRGLLRVGVQWNTQITLKDCRHTVSQVYCSALPVAYSEHASYAWEPFARLILEAAYEATVCAAIMNALNHGSARLFLTFLGGDSFGNEMAWITDALQRALRLYHNFGLDVAIVSYGRSNCHAQQLVSAWHA